MQQYFIKETLKVGTYVTLDDEILFHLKRVLRKMKGYEFRLIDKENKAFLCTLEDERAKVISAIKEERELRHELVLALALIKHDRFEWAIQKATELGVSKIIPLISERVMIKDDSEVKRIKRYQKIAKEAAEQSLRHRIPEITSFMSLDEVASLPVTNKLLAYEKEEEKKLEDYDDDTLIVIGPEGGFSKKEYQLLMECGFSSISLGKRILRAETAAIAAVCIIGRGME